MPAGLDDKLPAVLLGQGRHLLLSHLHQAVAVSDSAAHLPQVEIKSILHLFCITCAHLCTTSAPLHPCISAPVHLCITPASPRTHLDPSSLAQLLTRIDYNRFFSRRDRAAPAQ